MAVIVAIPDDNDYVWKISSEKVPHLTLCYLGEDIPEDDLLNIVEYVEFVAKTSMSKFGLNVSKRGVLGPESADVLFFSSFGVEKLETVRSYLLKNDAIYEAYNSIDQYESYVPHLTLGYPATPAKKDDRDYPGFSWVNFNRIAVWFGDSEGPIFDLKDESEHSLAGAAWSDLAHYGVKGMRWGKRKGHSPSASDGLNAHHTTSEDIQKINESITKVKSGGTKTLSNKELKQLVERMNMEQQFSSLSVKPSKIDRGQKTAQRILAVGATVNAAIAFSKSPAGQALLKSLK